MDSIFITGAGAGIGLATARLFAAKGWFVGAADRDASALESLRQEIGSGNCSVHVVDVTDEGAMQQALADFASHSGGKLRVLHNNAGILKVGKFEEIGVAEHRRIVEVNVIGLLNVLHAAFPYLRATPGAQVINMSSASAIYGIPDFASYSASKHAVRALTEALDIEWECHGIRVCDLMPPFVNTGMVKVNEGESRLFTNLGIKLVAEEVAHEVWSLVHRPQLHRPVTFQFRALWPLVRVAPAGLTRRIMRYLWTSEA
ncbi:SDR family oxidoreductase [Noviherbaspirillum massiliense]|uniref:SDR family oxidoreductase n=1 Tax=Noviherbaspirillum massiliense TaxID=1465823 RepID=UPI0002D41900|nr:SDR family oxidoreductase [Noviherbaspirillum massiliense]